MKPDQLTTIHENKADMERKSRWTGLPGDVGFGKTGGGAGRLQSGAGRQTVAMLVPTTLLAKQHRDLHRALLGFPRVRSLSRRDRQDKEIWRICAMAAEDHRYAPAAGKRSSSDLGLVIIDEEQRFVGTRRR